MYLSQPNTEKFGGTNAQQTSHITARKHARVSACRWQVFVVTYRQSSKCTSQCLPFKSWYTYGMTNCSVFVFPPKASGCQLVHRPTHSLNLPFLVLLTIGEDEVDNSSFKSSAAARLVEFCVLDKHRLSSSEVEGPGRHQFPVPYFQ